jgi:membrane protease YdiL (CAAX protease family)
MQNILAISGSWHDPFPGLKRAAALLFSVAALEFAAVLLQHQQTLLPSIYVLALLRVSDIAILVVWGSWPLSRHYLQAGLRDSIPIVALLCLCGVAFLISWRLFFGQSLFEGRRGAIFLLTSCLLAPIAEELVFRGILYRMTREWWNAAVCTIVISLLFAGLHFAFHQAPFLPFCGSLVFCLAYEKTKSILSPILVHIMGNLIIYALPLLPL